MTYANSIINLGFEAKQTCDGVTYCIGKFCLTPHGNGFLPTNLAMGPITGNEILQTKEDIIMYAQHRFQLKLTLPRGSN